MDEVEGYPLFKEMEDKGLQTRNRAIVFANIVEDNLYAKTGMLTEGGKLLVSTYWEAIGGHDNDELGDTIIKELEERGILERSVDEYKEYKEYKE